MSHRLPSKRSRASTLALAALLVTGPVALLATPASATAGPVGQDAGVTPMASVPGQPVDVIASGGDGFMTVSWSPAPDNGSPLTGYTVTAWPGSRVTAGDANATTVTTDGAATSATLTGLENWRGYDISVRAANAQGVGAESSPTQGMPRAVPLPGAPSGVQARPGERAVIVSWQPPAPDGNVIRRYVIRYVQVGGQYVSSHLTYTAETSAALSLQAGATYTFTVAAVNERDETGAESAPSAPLTVTEREVNSGGAITAAYAASGGSAGPLGALLQAEQCSFSRIGCVATYTGGSLYWSPASGAHWVRGAIEAKWHEERWIAGSLGLPTSDETPLGGGAVSHFEGGSIYWSAATGPHVVRGLIRDRWVAAGGPGGPLGYPVLDETGLSSGAVSVFQGGSVYFSPATGAHVVKGAIFDKWSPSRVNAPLGYPVSDEIPLVGGAVSYFQGGAIYWSPGTGAHEVKGLVHEKWAASGRETGALGYPVTDEAVVMGGAASHFQGGSVYFSPVTGAHVVRGAIRDKWASSGWENGVLGFPATDEVLLRNGAVTHFQLGSIYFSPVTGAHIVKGSIRDRWASLGWQDGLLGYPISDEDRLGRGGQAVTHFQTGSVYFSPETGAHAVWGAIRDKWASMGWQNSSLGYPTSEEYDVPGGRRSDFQFGSITWTPAKGAVSSR